MNEKIIELLILFAIAAFVLFRLRSVIGTRTGFEAPPEHLRRDPGASAAQTAKPAAPADPEDEDMGFERPLPKGATETIARIRQAEPDFHLAQFLNGARSAYEMILMAYEGGDRDTLKDLLAPDVYAAFDQMIAQRESQGLHVEARFVGVRDARVEGVEIDEPAGEADITIRFVGEMITAVRDAENRVVEGDPNEIRRQTDVWTFSRKLGARDPNWQLSATGE